MKELISHEQNLGDNGGMAKAQVGIENQNLVARIEVSHPLAPIVDKATEEADKLVDKVKNAIPGDWDDKLLDQFKAEYKQALVDWVSK